MTHQCAEGNNLVDSMGDPGKKPTRFLTTAIMLGAKFNIIRCDSAREHTSVTNRPKGTASSLGNWTANLAKTILGGIGNQRGLDKQHGGYARYANNLPILQRQRRPCTRVQRRS
eukprot:1585515-Pyramimonas_sp.AAC.1